MPRKNSEFHRLLAARGQTINGLVAVTGAGRSHLSQVINNNRGDKPGRGRHTRGKLYAVLTEQEIAALGWQAEFDAWFVALPIKDQKKVLQSRPRFVPLNAVPGALQ